MSILFIGKRIIQIIASFLLSPLYLYFPIAIAITLSTAALFILISLASHHIIVLWGQYSDNDLFSFFFTIGVQILFVALLVSNFIGYFFDKDWPPRMIIKSFNEEFKLPWKGRMRYIKLSLIASFLLTFFIVSFEIFVSIYTGFAEFPILGPNRWEYLVMFGKTWSIILGIFLLVYLITYKIYQMRKKAKDIKGVLTSKKVKKWSFIESE